MSTVADPGDSAGASADASSMTARRRIPAPASEIFALLADPTRHKETEPGDWVRDAVTTEPISGVGDVFVMNMYIDARGGHYVMHNVVTAFDPDRTLEWEPGQPDDTGEVSTGGWRWRYDLTPVGESTDVALRYDWSATPPEVIAEIGGMPPFGPGFLEASLASLESALRR
ncbi:SRPBCC family protein [Dietzia sp. B32]|uniref:SRPBCC family protein n=1 Tax=Dietzia sp. B32 TaxID=2915130 RepID=UPI0037C08F70